MGCKIGVSGFGNNPTLNIKGHVGGGEHQSRLKEKQSHGPGPQGQSVLQMLHQHADKTPRYSHTPSLAAFSIMQMRSHFRTHSCPGFYHDMVTYNGVEYDVSFMKAQCCNDGPTWYSSPHFECTVTVDGVERTIKGTIFHKGCQIYDCTVCPTVPFDTSFKKRVMRFYNTAQPAQQGQQSQQAPQTQEPLQSQAEHAQQTQEPSQSQAEHAQQTQEPLQSVPGVAETLQFTNMTHARLVEHARSVKRKLDTLRLDNYRMARKVLLLQSQLQPTNVADRAVDAMVRGSLPELAQLVVRCTDSGAFEGRSALLTVFTSALKNLVSLHKTGKKNGFRHGLDSKALFEMAYHMGGPLVHDFLSQNLLGPSLNTSKKEFRAIGIHYEGQLSEELCSRIFDFMVTMKVEKGIEGIVPLELSEDETALIQRATYNRRADVIEGFCGPKSEVHRCSFACRP
jgi:hypothetical protein